VSAIAAENDGLIRDIIANPSDDVPRIILADWLEDNGQSGQAEFIRLGLRMAELGDECQRRQGFLSTFMVEPSPCGDCGYCALAKRMEALHRAGHHTTPDLSFAVSTPTPPLWSASKSPAFLHRNRGNGPILFYRRGFVDSITLPLALFMEMAVELFRSSPITEVRLMDRKPRHMVFGDARESLITWHKETNEGDCEMEFFVTKPLFGLLGKGKSGNSMFWKEYDTDNCAALDLSAACCLYGREQAALTEPVPVGG
jgi:uncharacterized protein (TIGR02996 family)